MRACVLVGGGDAPGVNAILRGFIHQATRSSVEVYGSRYGFEGLVDPQGIVPLSLESVRGILPRGGSILGCSTRMSPFFHVTKDSPEPRDICPDIANRLRALSIDVLVLAGGDGTMLAATRFMQLGIPCVGIPKTIDNDVGGTDQACGFDSAIETATHAIDALHSTAESHQRVMIVETIGHRRGPSHRKLRRAAGELPQRERGKLRRRGCEEGVREPLYPARDQLPRGHGLRPHEGRALGGRAEDGARRSCERRRHLHARSRDGPPRSHPDHVELRPRRERGAGASRPRPVLRAQGDAAPRLPTARVEEARYQGSSIGLRRWRVPAGEERARPGAGARGLVARGARGDDARALVGPDRGALLPQERC